MAGDGEGPPAALVQDEGGGDGEPPHPELEAAAHQAQQDVSVPSRGQDRGPRPGQWRSGWIIRRSVASGPDLSRASTRVRGRSASQAVTSRT